MSKSSIVNLLPCPNCGGTRFNQLPIGEFKKDEVDFKTTLIPLNQSVVYICPCGTVIDENTANMEKQIVIITGESIKYRSRAILSTGLDLPKKLDWDRQSFIVLKDTIFVTKKTWESPPTELIQLLENKNIRPYDVSDGDCTQLKDLLTPKKEVK